jgi:hypothetical protein
MSRDVTLLLMMILAAIFLVKKVNESLGGIASMVWLFFTTHALVGALWPQQSAPFAPSLQLYAATTAVMFMAAPLLASIFKNQSALLAVLIYILILDSASRLTTGATTFHGAVLAMCVPFLVKTGRKNIAIISVLIILLLKSSTGIAALAASSVVVWPMLSVPLLAMASLIFYFKPWAEMRFHQWPEYLRSYLDGNLLLGRGTGSLEYYGPRIMVKSEEWFSASFRLGHNEFIQILHDTGVIGLLLFCVLIIVEFIRNKDKYTRAMILAFVVTSIFYYPLRIPISQAIVFLLYVWMKNSAEAFEEKAK